MCKYTHVVIKGLGLFFCLIFIVPVATAAVPTVITYQGRLTDGSGDPVADGSYSVVFTIYDALSAGNSKWTETRNITTTDGSFSVVLGSSTPIVDTVFNQPDRWLGIAVSPDPEMTPRQQVASAPYSYRVRTVDGATGGNLYGDLQLHSTMTIGDNAGDVGKLEITDGSSTRIVADGTTGTVQMTGFKLISAPTNGFVLTSDATGVGTWQSSGAGSGWSLTGNSGTTPGTNFLGTTDNNALELKVNGSRALRIEPNATSPNIIGGFSGNSITTGAVGATISGGGTGGGNPNQVSASYGTVGGGYWNRAESGGTVGGGLGNYARDHGASVGGGVNNTAGNVGSQYATVGGGAGNTATGAAATVGGGSDNAANGQYAAVAGGQSNTAAGDFSFAAGRRAKANHGGTFVWADQTAADFASTAPNQFLIRADAVGIGTPSPAEKLDVAGTAQVTGFKMPTGATSGYVLTSGATGVGTWQAAGGSGTPGGTNGSVQFNNSGAFGGDAATFFWDNTNKRLGIGTASPVYKLDVNGDISAAGSLLLGTDLFFAGNNALRLAFGGELRMGWSASFTTATFYTSGGERVRISSAGNVGIGTTSPAYKLEVSGPVMMEDAAVPLPSAGHSGIYSSGGEVWAIDAAGNTSIQSPHDPATGDWIFYSKNIKTGRVVKVNMEKLVRKIEELTGEQFLMESWEKEE